MGMRILSKDLYIVFFVDIYVLDWTVPPGRPYYTSTWGDRQLLGFIWIH